MCRRRQRHARPTSHCQSQFRCSRHNSIFSKDPGRTSSLRRSRTLHRRRRVKTCRRRFTTAAYYGIGIPRAELSPPSSVR
ncbi:hypothetical protein LY76DRAFT_688560 [Colletotrichum caudatum]|nr:hypothetical protein LY76DRAFT_688560 [Colletotrichum caudatum]